MGGIVAHVSRAPSSPEFAAGLGIMLHNPVFQQSTYVDSKRLRLGAVYREQDPPSDVWLPEADVGVVVYGCALITGKRPTRATAGQIGEKYLEQGVEAVLELDGGFVTAIVDLRQDRLLVVNDRMATVPVHYLAEPGAVLVGPEAKAIFAMLGRSPRISAESALTFLNLGFALGDRCLFERIRLLEPAQILSVGLTSAEVERKTYWKLSFNPRRRLKAGEAADELYETMRTCHRAALVDRPAGVQLLLTGGYDSRAMLGILAEEGIPPDECLTWGVLADIPRSDPSIARAVSNQLGVPWRFLPYDGDGFATEALRWAFVSELSSDNFGSFAAGADMLYRGGGVGSAMLIGDQLMGIGGLPISRTDAISIATGLPHDGIAPGLKALLRPDRRAEAERLMTSQIQQLAGQCPNAACKDVLDFLSIKILAARWLNSAACFREPMVSVRRPMLMRPVIDLFATLPPALRVDKRLLVTMLRRRMPGLLRQPMMAASSLIDWDMHFTGNTPSGALFRDLVAERSRLVGVEDGYLDSARLDDLVSTYFGRVRSPINRTPVPERLLPGLRRALSRIPMAGRGLRGIELAARDLLRRPAGASGDRVLKRIALLVLLQRCIDDGRFGRPPGPSDFDQTSHATWFFDHPTEKDVGVVGKGR